VRRREVIALIGGAAVAPAAGAHAQPMPAIGYLSVGSPQTDNIPGRLIAFRKGLNEMGFVEGQNVAIEYRWAEGQYDRLAAFAADLVHRQVSAIVALAAPPAIAAKSATSTIPIVFILGIDPVEAGVVTSFNRPGGNITGVELLTGELAGKRLDLLHEFLPTVAIAALLVNPTNPANRDSEAESLQDAARALGLQAHILQASTPSEIDVAFAAIGELRVGALVVSGDPLFTNQRDQIVALAARYAVPAVYNYREFAAAGGLMSYGADLAEGYRQAGIHTGKILQGAQPADLPVQQVVKLELVINLNTAKALGLTVPLTLLGRADEVIE
jgi:putative tryptophan/tyrosine transport system substrate-binding protein